MEARRRRLIEKLLVFLAAIVVASAVPATVARGASANAGGITVTASSGQNSFPNQIVFGVRTQSSSEISWIRLDYREGDEPITVEGSATFKPGFSVDASYAINLLSDYHPPGVVLHYQWRIQDMSGAEIDTAWADVNVTDLRFGWHERTRGNVILHWYDGDDAFADAVLASATKAFTAAQRDALAPWLGSVNVFLYGNSQDFRSALGAGASEWAGGITFPAQHVVVLLTPSNDLSGAQRSVAHELTHAAIDGARLNPFGSLPAWLDEGIAVMAEGDSEPRFVDALAAGAKSHQLMSIQSLSGNFPESNEEAILAYAESESLVRFFVQSYGRDRLASLIAAFRAGDSPDEAFQASVGINVADYQRAWMASLGAKTTTSVASGAQSAATRDRSSATPGEILANVVRGLLQLFQSAKSNPA